MAYDEAIVKYHQPRTKLNFHDGQPEEEEEEEVQKEQEEKNTVKVVDSDSEPEVDVTVEYPETKINIDPEVKM